MAAQRDMEELHLQAIEGASALVEQYRESYRRLSYTPPRPNLVPVDRVRPRRDILYLASPSPAPVEQLPASVLAIKRAVAESHGFTVEAIDGEGRTPRLVVARREAIVAVARARPGWSLPRLGRAFHRDHTTILHHLRAAGLREVPSR